MTVLSAIGAVAGAGASIYGATQGQGSTQKQQPNPMLSLAQWMYGAGQYMPFSMNIGKAYAKLPKDKYGYAQTPELPMPTMLEDPTYLTDVPMYNIPEMPGYGDLSPEMRASIESPYKETSMQLQEQLGSIGALGSAGAGVSGAGASVLGDYWGNTVAPQLARAAYDYYLPIWQQNLQRNIMDYTNKTEEGRMSYQNYADYTNQLYGRAMKGWETEYQKLMMPYQTYFNVAQGIAGAQNAPTYYTQPPSGMSQLASTYGPSLFSWGANALSNSNFGYTPTTTAKTYTPIQSPGYPTY